MLVRVTWSHRPDYCLIRSHEYFIIHKHKILISGFQETTSFVLNLFSNFLPYPWSSSVRRFTVTFEHSCVDLGYYLCLGCLCPNHIMLKSYHPLSTSSNCKTFLSHILSLKTQDWCVIPCSLSRSDFFLFLFFFLFILKAWFLCMRNWKDSENNILQICKVC